VVAAPRPLLAFLLEQLLTNGLGAWLEWQAMHRVLWFVVVMHALIFSAVVSTAIDRPRFRSRPAASLVSK